jgi:hypothetical protein
MEIFVLRGTKVLGLNGVTQSISKSTSKKARLGFAKDEFIIHELVRVPSMPRRTVRQVCLTSTVKWGLAA